MTALSAGGAKQGVYHQIKRMFGVTAQASTGCTGMPSRAELDKTLAPGRLAGGLTAAEVAVPRNEVGFHADFKKHHI